MFRIGEFSKIAQVSGHLLRYYDEIGLLKPSKTDEWTGYRYYSAEQLPRLNRILVLKDLGFTLEQIGRILEEEMAPNELRSMLTLRKAQIEQSIQEELDRLKHIEARLDQIDNEGKLANMDIMLKAVEERPFLAMRYQLPHLSQGKNLLNALIKLIPDHVGKKNIQHFAAVFHSDMFSVENVDIEVGFLLNEPQDVQIPVTDIYTMTLRTLPSAPLAVTTIRNGLPQVGHLSYAALGTWVEANGYEFAGPGREIFLVPPLHGKEAETVTEIQFPVRRVAMG